MERWESLQKEATAAGFAYIEDYINHKRDTDPRKCRIAYEKYKKLVNNEYGGIGNNEYEFDAVLGYIY
ncbi:hypothetical protein CsSME_00000144 [Camellia sinensis var. sinensis]